MEREGRGHDDAWYRRWFGETYLEVYPHRDREEARRAVDLFLDHIAPPPGRILDLGCGAGRHLDALRDRAVDPVVGLDLSAPLLRQAAGSGHVRLVRADMRALPFGPRGFASVTSFFTSFGYFRHPRDDRRVLAEAARVLRPDGVLLLDYLNAPRVREELVAQDERTIGERTVRQHRWIEDGTVKKRIEVEREEGPPRVFHERVRLYDADDLTMLLTHAGFAVEGRFGDYDGSGYRRAAPRLILVGRLSGRPPADDPGSRKTAP